MDVIVLLTLAVALAAICAHLELRAVPFKDLTYAELVHLMTDPLQAMFTAN